MKVPVNFENICTIVALYSIHRATDVSLRHAHVLNALFHHGQCRIKNLALYMMILRAHPEPGSFDTEHWNKGESKAPLKTLRFL